MKKLLFLGLLLLVTTAQAQQNGQYLQQDDPLVQAWEFVGGYNQGVILAGVRQKYLFIKGGNSKKNMVAMTYSEGLGYACPSYFTLTKEKDKLHFNFGITCRVNILEQDKKTTLSYKLQKNGTELVLKQNYNKYVYVLLKKKR